MNDSYTYVLWTLFYTIRSVACYDTEQLSNNHFIAFIAFVKQGTVRAKSTPTLKKTYNVSVQRES